MMLLSVSVTGRYKLVTHVSLEDSQLSYVMASQVVATIRLRKLTLYQGNRSSGRSFHVRYIYTPYCGLNIKFKMLFWE